MKNNSYFIFGKHAVYSALTNTPELVLELFASKQFINKTAAFIDQANSCGLIFQVMDKKKLDALTDGALHQDVIARIKNKDSLNERFLEELVASKPNLFLLVLDGVTDANNLGACLRNADAVGVDAVILPKNNSASLSPAVYKTASGAASAVKIITVTNLSRTLNFLKENDVWVFGAAGEAKQDLYQIEFTRSLALVLGAEGKGLRDLTKKHCDYLVSLPMKGYVSSLNVAVASGVLLYEASRQRSSLIA